MEREAEMGRFAAVGILAGIVVLGGGTMVWVAPRPDGRPPGPQSWGRTADGRHALPVPVRAVRRVDVGSPPPAPPRNGEGSNASEDCGPRALRILMAKMGIAASLEELGRLAGTDTYGTTMEGLRKAAEAKGLRAEGLQMDGAALRTLDKPACLWVDGDHYIAVLKVDGDRATIHDPNAGGEEVVQTDALLRRSGGILLTLQKQKQKPL